MSTQTRTCFTSALSVGILATAPSGRSSSESSSSAASSSPSSAVQQLALALQAATSMSKTHLWLYRGAARMHITSCTVEDTSIT